MASFIQLLWFFLLYGTLFLFVLLDGADLGIGILSLGARNEQERSEMMATIGPLWYANETWLVIGGAVLFGAFPLAYGLLLTSLYIPTMMLLFGLMTRAVSVEFRAHSEGKRAWGAGFGAGSLLAALGLGFLLGGMLSGLRVEGGTFKGGAWDWLNPVAAITAVGIVAGYATLGAAYMVRRTSGEFQAFSRRLTLVSAVVSFCLFVAVIVLLPLLATPFRGQWDRPPHIYTVPVFMLVTGVGLVMMLRASRAGAASDRAPYIWGLVVYMSAAAAVVAGIFPYFVPFTVTIAEATASRQTLVFMIFGVGVILPIIVVYNLYARGIFRGKVHDIREDY
jgi:cytochrome d ubiquinol oxidase subunit II